MTAGAATELDLTDAALYQSGVPHEVFTELRAQGPVHWHRPVVLPPATEPMPFWSLVRHAEIQHVNRDWEHFSATRGPQLMPLPPMPPENRIMITMDPPEHTLFRRLVSAGFTPRMVARLDDHIVERAVRIFDEAVEREAVDFVADVAFALPMHVIADLVGISEAERPWVFERTETMLKGMDPTRGVPPEVSMAATLDLHGYAQQLSDAKRRAPGDDVWSRLMGARVTRPDGSADELTGTDLANFFVLLVIGGSETTRHAIAAGLLALADNPDQMQVLRDDPAAVRPGSEEILRWSSPVLYFGRTATRDVEIADARIAAGDRVVLWYPSGNRDERVFADPFHFDVRRDPNPHMTFGGGGPHYCLGANLARQEVDVVLRMLAQRYDVEITGEPLWPSAGPAVNVGVALEHLPVRITRSG